MADRNSDPDHSFDLALRRPARLKRALISSQRAGGPRTAGSALCLDPQAIAGSLKSIELAGALKARARDRGSSAVNPPDNMATHHAVS